MLSLCDTFTEYLYSGLSGSIKVVWLRTTPNDSQNARLHDNALNISFLSFPKEGRIEQALVSLDILGSDERTVLAQAETVRDYLSSVQYTPEYSYQPNPDTPVPTGQMVCWDGDIDFDVIASDDHYHHVNATFLISHAR